LVECHTKPHLPGQTNACRDRPGGHALELGFANVPYKSPDSEGTLHRQYSDVDIELAIRFSALQRLAPIEKFRRRFETVLAAASRRAPQVFHGRSSVNSGN
jgi:hypothetical protein